MGGGVWTRKVGTPHPNTLRMSECAQRPSYVYIWHLTTFRTSDVCLTCLRTGIACVFAVRNPWRRV